MFSKIDKLDHPHLLELLDILQWFHEWKMEINESVSALSPITECIAGVPRS